MKQKKSGSGRRIVCLVLAAVMLLGLVSSALIIMVNAASSSEIKKELSGLRNQQAELKKEREALQAKIKENQSKTQTLVDKKSDIDQQISMTQASINNLNEQVQQYSLLIANKQAELEASQAEEQRLNEQYKTRIRSMEETGNISYWAILFGANSFSDLLDKIDVIQEIAKADQLMLEKMKAVSEQIASERTELEQQMAELDTTREELDQQEAELEAQRTEADSLLLEMMQAYEEMNADYEQNMADEAELSDRDFVIGVRPEFIRISDDGALEGEVYSAMPTGMETTVRIRLGNYLLTGVVFGGVLYRLGQKVRLDFDGQNAVLYARKNGKLIAQGSLTVE